MPPGTVRLRVPDIVKARGMTASELAQATGLTFNTASALARGFYDRIGLETIARLCDGLKVQPGELFEYTPEPIESET
jgi:DNA-binding Xre family transcriptional regulator